MSSSCNPIRVNNNSVSDGFFEDLIKGEIPAIVIPNLLNSGKCQELVQDILTHKTSPGIGFSQKIGESVNSYGSNKMDYFKNVKQSNRYLKKIFSHIDPRNIMLQKISEILKGKICFAYENDMPYSKGIIRFHIPGELGYIHRDNVRFDASEFSVSKLSGQFSAVLYLQPSESGGELVIFDRFWKSSDEKFRTPYFGYSNDVIKQTPFTYVKCNQGDLIIINTNKYHAINMVKGKLKRITLSFFFGKKSESNFLAWS